MDTAEVHALVDDLTDNIDDLQESLTPLLRAALSQSTSKLPLLDKAKLYVLVTYAIESVLFSCLRLNGVEAKLHPVFQELTRVKEYFAKLKSAETAGTKRNNVLDKDAAGRFIKHGLAGNQKVDRERTERIALAKAGAKRKLEDIGVGTHTRFDGVAKRVKASENEGDADSTFEGNSEAASAKDDVSHNPAAHGPATEAVMARELKAERKAMKRQRRLEKKSAHADDTGEEPQATGEDDNFNAADSDGQSEPSVDSEQRTNAVPKKKKSKRNRRSKGQKLEDERADEMK